MPTKHLLREVLDLSGRIFFSILLARSVLHLQQLLWCNSSPMKQESRVDSLQADKLQVDTQVSDSNIHRS